MPISPQQARRFYDWFGARQDSQARYEDVGLDALIEGGDFEHAHRVFELGSGTGRLAERLLGRHLPADATYVGQDVSATMVQLARERLRPWADRASIRHSDGSLRIGGPDGSYDRFVATYVLDLMPIEDIDAVLVEAHRLLEPDGRLCLVALTHGVTLPSRIVSGLWGVVAHAVPQWVGGCRPIDLRPHLVQDDWELVHERVVTAIAVPSQVLIARRRGHGGS